MKFSIIFAFFFCCISHQVWFIRAEQCGKLIQGGITQWNHEISIKNSEILPIPQISEFPYIQGVEIKRDCRLTIKNGGGDRITFVENFNDLSQVGFYRYCRSWVPVRWSPWNKERIETACCSCGKCQEALQSNDQNICAKLFDADKCDSCSPSSNEIHDIRVGQNIPFCWAKAGSLFVKPGCSLSIFNQPNYSGDEVTFRGGEGIDNFRPPQGWDGQRICSYKCTC